MVAIIIGAVLSNYMHIISLQRTSDTTITMAPPPVETTPTNEAIPPEDTDLTMDGSPSHHDNSVTRAEATPPPDTEDMDT